MRRARRSARRACASRRRRDSAPTARSHSGAFFSSPNRVRAGERAPAGLPRRDENDRGDEAVEAAAEADNARVSSSFSSSSSSSSRLSRYRRMPAATKCSKALFWIASWSAATGSSSTPCFCSAARKSVTLRSQTAAAVARCAASTRQGARFLRVSFSDSDSSPASSSRSKLASNASIAFTGSVAAPFTWSRSASTTPVSPSRNRSSSRRSRRSRRVSAKRARASARSRALARFASAPARASAARARRCRTSSASRARASSSSRRCSAHARAAATRVARRGPTATTKNRAYEFHPPRREPHLVRGLVVLPTPQPASPDVFRAAAEPQPRAFAMRVGKRRLALFSAFFSAFVVVRLKAQVRVAGGDGAKRDVPSPHIHHHVVRGVREEPASASGSASAPGTSVNAGVNVACSEVPPPPPCLPDVDARPAARSASAATSRRKGVPSEEQRTTTSPSRTSLRVEPGTSARVDVGKPRLRGRPTMFPIAGACVARAALRGAPIGRRSLLLLQ